VPVRPALVLASTGIAALSLSIVAPAVALADPPQDPPGNNGTIKIQPYGGSGGAGNSPHPGCDFRLQLFGFDEGQTGTITFAGQAPTAGAVTAQPLSGSRLLSDDRAGGGRDVDAHFDVRGADLGLTGAAAKQGFHVKVRVDADDAPGGAKTKVFWLSCPSATAAPSATPAAPAAGTATAPSTSVTAQGVTSAPVTSATSATSAVAGSATSSATGTPATTGRTTTLGRTTDQALAESAPVTTTTPGSATTRSTGRTGASSGLALPFTGAPAAALAALGVAALTAGGLAVAAGRRRRTAPDAG